MAIYLDYNATTPYDEEVKKTITAAMTDAWGNPSSSHEFGIKAQKALQTSREQVASMLFAAPEEIIFTSGGTESNHLVIESAMTHFETHCKRNPQQTVGPKPHVITSNIEHDSITVFLRTLQTRGVIDVSFVPVCEVSAQILLEDISTEIRNETCLITIMLANNETGIIQPIKEIGAFVQKTNSTRAVVPILFHTDAAQAIGKIKIMIPELNVDFLTIVGHKFYGPRIGALFVRDLYKNSEILRPIFYGGGQERGYRPGTENVAMIAGLGMASLLVGEHLDEYRRSMLSARKHLEKKLVETFEGKIQFNNVRIFKVQECDKVIIKEVPRLPNTVSVSFKSYGLTGAAILAKTPNVCASTGSACHSGKEHLSVLKNCGVGDEVAKATIRLSVGRETTKLEIDQAVEFLRRALH